MPPSQKFSAPWGRQLRWITGITCALLLATSALLYRQTPPAAADIYLVGIWLPIAIILAGALFGVRGYAVAGDVLWVQRPLWRTRVSLQGRTAVEHDPQAMTGALRLFGNGGLFSYLGLFRSQRLGRFRAFATDPRNAVVIRFPERTLVVTPDRPEQFARLLSQGL